MKKHTIHHVIKVSPSPDIARLPKGFVDNLRKKKKIQEGSFRLFIKPLTHREYKIYSGNRYSIDVILTIINNNVMFPDDEYGPKYIIKWALLIKEIIDTIFSISGRTIELINRDPELMFRTLSNYRNIYSTMDSLIDRFILANAGMETYMRVQKFTTIEEKFALAALIEMETDVILEERYELAQKTKRPINISPDRNFRKNFGSSKNDGVEDIISESQSELNRAMKRDKRLQDLGIKRKVDTSRENEVLSSM